MVDSNRILQLLYGDSAQVDSAISDVVIVEGAVATDDAERIPGLVGQDGADVPASHHSICFIEQIVAVTERRPSYRTIVQDSEIWREAGILCGLLAQLQGNVSEQDV